MMLDETPAIETSGLVKLFGPTRAVDGIDLLVPAGSVCGILGPNGAGKTTTIRMLATLLRPDGGQALVFGHDVVTQADVVRGRVSLTGQFASVDEELTARENLIVVARLLGHRSAAARTRAAELLDAFGLADVADRLVATLSGGQRRRLDIAASIVVTPDLLFLDEPTTGLDPLSRQHVWEIVRALVAERATVLLTTQNLDEADHLANQIVLFDHGKIVAAGSPGDLKASVGSATLHVGFLDPHQAARAKDVLSVVLDAAVHHDPGQSRLSVPVSDAARATDALAALSRADLPPTDFALGQPTLDEVFLVLTGHMSTEASAGVEQA